MGRLQLLLTTRFPICAIICTNSVILWDRSLQVAIDRTISSGMHYEAPAVAIDRMISAKALTQCVLGQWLDGMCCMTWWNGVTSWSESQQTFLAACFSRLRMYMN